MIEFDIVEKPGRAQATWRVIGADFNGVGVHVYLGQGIIRDCETDQILFTGPTGLKPMMQALADTTGEIVEVADEIKRETHQFEPAAQDCTACGGIGQVECTNHGATPAVTYDWGVEVLDYDTCGECDQPNDWGAEPGEDGPPMRQCEECF